jgi:zeaxanthin glucosyltransferase
MSRFLFVVLPLTGHVNAPLAVAAALAERGHEVAWVGPTSYLRPLVGPEVTVYPTGLRFYPAQADRGLVAVQTLWSKFVMPFAQFIRPAVEKAVEAFRPDVVAVDQHAVAGAVVATRHDLLWASLAPQCMELTRPLRTLPTVEGWIRTQLDTVWARAGEAGPAPLDLRFSPHLVLGFTSALLTGLEDLPPRCELVGPAMHRRLNAPPFPWERLQPATRTVLVSMGTMSVDVARGFFGRIAEAMAELDLQVVLNCPPEAVPEPGPRTIVAERVPMLELLPAVDAVVCHAGLNTVVEAMAHAVPLVLAPIRNDQPVIANQVVAAGAGIRVRFARATPAQLRTAVTTVLDDRSYAEGAARVRDSFPAEGGAVAAAHHLIDLAHRA